MTTDERVALKLAIQRALLGNVNDSLIAVTATIEKKVIKVHFYYEGEITEEIVELSHTISGETQGDFSEEYLSEDQVFSIKDKKPEMLDFWAFMRKKEK